MRPEGRYDGGAGKDPDLIALLFAKRFPGDLVDRRECFGRGFDHFVVDGVQGIPNHLDLGRGAIRPYPDHELALFAHRVDEQGRDVLFRALRHHRVHKSVGVYFVSLHVQENCLKNPNL